MNSKEMLLDVKKRNEALKREGHFHIGEIAIKVIEKLVERDTPMKPISESIELICPKCREEQHTNTANFCSECGQRLDWS